MRSRLIGLWMVGLALVLSGCDRFKGQPDKPAVQEITVVLREWQVIPAHLTIPAGKVRFVVKNQGTMDHGFEIEGPDLEEEIDPFPAGQTRSLELELAPGTYEIYCQVPGHEDLGMKGELIVKP